MLTLLLEDLHASTVRERVKAAVSAKKKCLLIVPEQETLRAEASMARELPDFAPLCFEVTNFSRLANTVFRAKGGISLHYADASASALVMWKVLDALKPLLQFDDKSSDTTRVSEMLSAKRELCAAGIGEDRLEEISRLLPEGERLRARLADMSQVLRSYRGELSTVYGDHVEDLDRLAALLREDAFFADTLIFVDSFTSFTEQEHRVLNELMRAGELTVSLPTVPHDTRSFAYKEPRATAERLSTDAKHAGVPCREEKGASLPLPPAIALAREELFSSDKKITPATEHTAKEGLSLWREEDPFSASAAIASDIARRVREGARYRDFVIFANDPRAYRGIMDAALEKQGIPSFLSDERDIFSFSVVKMILTAYTVLLRGYRKEDIIAFLKCGFGDFSEDDIDLYELYSDFWHLGGRLFTSGEPLSMNPSGYKKKFSERETKTLSRVNAVRNRLLTLFGILSAVPDDAAVSKHLTALYSFLTEISCEKRLSALAATARQNGDKADADILERLFGVLCGLMDRAYEILHDTALSKERFADMLTLLFSSMRLGQLPTSQDAVMIGSAGMLRADGASYVYLLGVNEGEFPAAVKSGGVFDEHERAILAKHAAAIAFDPMTRSAREAFCFLRALTSAQNHATVVSYTKTALGEKVLPSAVFASLSVMLGKVSAHPQKEVFRPRAAAEMIGEWEGKPEKEALLCLFGEDASFSRFFESSLIPLSDTECRLSEELSHKLFSEKISATQSLVEQYVKCPFSYYCKHLLKLGEKRDSTFGLNDIGTLIHAVAEHFFLTLEKEGKSIRSIRREDISLYVEGIARDYITAVCPNELRSSPRLLHTMERLKRTARLLLEELYEEFSNSEFSPTCFEFKVGEDGGPDSISFPTADGAEVVFHGTVDRIDTYRAKNGGLYFRVIDYKTGTKVFSLSDIEKGKNLQLLIYLVSLWKSKDTAFLNRLASAGEQPLPAGMLYMSASPKDIELEAPLPAEEIADRARAGLTSNGLVLAEMEIVEAMDKTLSGRFVPSPCDKKGNIVWGSSFVTMPELEGIHEGLKRTVGAIGTAMRSGVASAMPLEEGRDSPCSYCPYKTVCRRTV